MDSLATDMNLILQKIRNYCAYQERCCSDTNTKLKLLGLDNAEQRNNILEMLTSEGFINEARFTELFVRGKLVNNQWGKQKIIAELRTRRIPEILINAEIQKIDTALYEDILRSIIIKKKKAIKNLPDHIVNNKIVNYAAGRGFEVELTLKILKNK